MHSKNSQWGPGLPWDVWVQGTGPALVESSWWWAEQPGPCSSGPLSSSPVHWQRPSLALGPPPPASHQHPSHCPGHFLLPFLPQLPLVVGAPGSET